MLKKILIILLALSILSPGDAFCLRPASVINTDSAKAAEKEHISPTDRKLLDAIAWLRQKGKSITRALIAEEAGVNVDTVTNRKNANPTVKRAIEEAHISPTDRKLLDAIVRLRQKRKPITRALIAKEAGVSVATVTRRKNLSPAVRKAIEEASPLSTDRKLLDTIAWLCLKGKPITQALIAEGAGVDVTTVTNRKNANPTVKRAIEEAYISPTDRKLLGAIARLRQKRKHITQVLIAEEAGVRVATVTRRKNLNPAVRKAIEEASPLSTDRKLLDTIAWLCLKGKPITQALIAEKAGVSVDTVTNRKNANPTVKRVIEEAYISLTDRKLLDTIARLCQKRKPITQVLIAKEAGVRVATVTNRKNLSPAVRKAIEEVSPLSTDRKLLDTIAWLCLKEKHITQTLIAAEAGVSVATVTRRKNLNPAVRKAIYYAMYPNGVVYVRALQETADGTTGNHQHVSLISASNTPMPEASAIKHEFDEAVSHAIEQMPEDIRKTAQDAVDLIAHQQIDTAGASLEGAIAKMLNATPSVVGRIFDILRSELSEFSFIDAGTNRCQAPKAINTAAIDRAA